MFIGIARCSSILSKRKTIPLSSIICLRTIHQHEDIESKHEWRVFLDLEIEVKKRREYWNRQESLDPIGDHNFHFAANEDIVSKYEELKAKAHLLTEIEGRGVDFDKSPFGPISSSACFEELSDIHLSHLQHLRSTTGQGTLPSTKIRLTVVEPAVLSSSGIISAVVKDDHEHYCLLEIRNVTDVERRANEIVSMSVGHKFCLKNPYMKVVGPDGVPTIRVDQPFDLIRIDNPPLYGDILIVGDGDFSYSLELARLNAVSRFKALITSTSYETKETVCNIYAKGQENILLLEADGHVSVRHAVDATNLDRAFQDGEQWDSVVWNFPYSSKDTLVQDREMFEMLVNFLRNAKPRLRPRGKVFLTLVARQGGTSREVAASTRRWDMEKVARKAGFDLVEVVPFNSKFLADYEPLRSFKDEAIPFENAMTHVLSIKQESAPGEASSPRTIQTRLWNLDLDKSLRTVAPTHTFSSADDCIESVTPFAENCGVSAEILRAARSFKEVRRLLDPTGGSSDDYEFIGNASSVVRLLHIIFTSSEGFLIASLEPLNLNRAIACCFAEMRPILLDCAMHNGLSDLYEEIDALEIDGQDEIELKMFNILHQFHSVSDINWEQENGSLADGMLVFSALHRMKNESSADVSFLACQMFPSSIAIRRQAIILDHIRLQSALNENRISDFACLSKTIERACEVTLKLTKGHSRERLDVIHSMAFAVQSSIASQNSLSILSNGIAENRRLDGRDQKKIEEAVELYQKFIDRAHATDRRVPSVHYETGVLMLCLSCICDESDKRLYLRKARSFYELGLFSEHIRPSFFFPVNSRSKNVLSVATMLKDEDVFDIAGTEKAEQLQAKSVKQDVSNSQGQALSRSHLWIKALEHSSSRSYGINPGKVCKLLREQPGNKMNMSVFREAFHLKYGREPVPREAGAVYRALADAALRSESFHLARGVNQDSAIWVVLGRS